MYATSRTQHCVALFTTEVEYVALVEGAKEGMLVRFIMSFKQPNVYEITLFDGGQRGGQGNGGERAGVSTSM